MGCTFHATLICQVSSYNKHSMKTAQTRITILFVFCFILLASCEKKYLLPEKDLPGWLKASIEADLREIEENPKSINELGRWTRSEWKAYGRWIRTEWQNEYYYEYHNGLFINSIIRPISHYNDTLKIDYLYPTSPYYSEKCCTVLVWKGPGTH